MNTGQIPSLGRIVHFTCDPETAKRLNGRGGKRYNVGDRVAAMITDVGENNACYLTLFPVAEETLAIAPVPFSHGNQPGTWNWPERIGAVEEAA